ncbi:MAG: uncharacterized membrane protein YjgN (DUF898 family) [Chitinophagales bacterium]|jgi:uncharacterized membrane protein YjgN (DUF898 family)
MNKDYFSFHGEGGSLFGIYIKNIFLCLFTLGLYIPWAIVNITKYIYTNLEFKERRFDYTGTGKEIFKGFIKAILIIIGVALLVGLISSLGVDILTGLVMLALYLAYFLAIPYVMHYAMKYDRANTTYAGIRFGYRGDLEEFIKLFLKGVLFTILSLGIYGAWFSVDLRKYISKNSRLGNAEFSFEGDGMEYFILNVKGLLLSSLTLGIYMFWWIKDLFNYTVENTKMHYQEQAYSFNSEVSGGKLFGLFFTNMLLIVFTLGFGIAWADVRTYRFLCENCSLENDIDVESIEQTEPTYHDAIGIGGLEAMSN